MKYIIIIVNPARKEILLEELKAVGVGRLTLSDTRGYGSNTQHVENYRGQEYTVNNEPRLKVEIAVNDDYVEKVLKVVHDLAEGDSKGGGKVFVLPLEEVVRARTGEKGSEAIG